MKNWKFVYKMCTSVASGYVAHKLIEKHTDVLIEDLDGEITTINVVKAFTIGAGDAAISMAVGILTGAIIDAVL